MQQDSPKPSRKSSIRLQKYLAECGFGSRRACERLIADGQVMVDGAVIEVQGFQVDPSSQQITVRGRVIAKEQKLYVLLNKPRDILCTSSDPQGRRTFLDLLPGISERVYTVGRLDRDSEGLLLVTNDGALAERLTHPRYGTSKIYEVSVSRALKSSELARLTRGVKSQDDVLKAASVSLKSGAGRYPVYEIELREGKNRHIRRMLEVLGVEVVRLVRIQMGPLTLGSLCRGESRALTKDEVEELRILVADRK